MLWGSGRGQCIRWPRHDHEPHSRWEHKSVVMPCDEAWWIPTSLSVSCVGGCWVFTPRTFPPRLSDSQMSTWGQNVWLTFVCVSRLGLVVLSRSAGKRKDAASIPRFGSPFSSKIVIYGHCLVTLPCTINETVKWRESPASPRANRTEEFKGGFWKLLI